MKLNFTSTLLLLLGVAFCCSNTTHAEMIESSDLTDGSSTFVTGDGLVTLTPFALDGSAGALGAAGANFFGIQGDNDGAIDEVTDGAGVVQREQLDIAFDSTAAMTGIGFRWTRSDGPLATDGIELSGFLSDPMATVTAGTGVSATYDSGSLFIQHAWNAGTLSSLTFADSTASLGQVISITSNDSDQGNGQTAVGIISYDVAAVPEPTTGTCLALIGLGAFVRRRRN